MASWFDKIIPSFVRKDSKKKSIVPEGLWKTCPSCSAILYMPELETNLFVCPKCDHHIRIGARKRLDIFLDTNSQEELFKDTRTVDWLKFKDTKRYKDRLLSAQEASQETEALIIMQGTLLKLPIVCASFEFRFMGG